MKYCFFVAFIVVLISCSQHREEKKDVNDFYQRNLSVSLDSLIFQPKGQGFLDTLRYRKIKLKNLTRTSKENQIKLFYLDGLHYTIIKEGKKALALTLKADSILDKENIENDSLCASIYMLMSQIYALQKNSPKALTYGIRGIEKSKSSSLKQSGYLCIGNSYFIISDFENALVYYKKALENNTLSDLLSPLYNNMAICYSELNDRAKQRNYLLKCIQIEEKNANKNNPRYLDALSNMMYYYYGVEKDDSAKVYMDKYLQIDSTGLDASTYDMFADLLVILKEDEKAEKFIKEAMTAYIKDSLFTELAPLYKNLAAIKYDQKKYTDCIQLLDSAYWLSRKYNKKIVIEETKKIERDYTIKLKAEEVRSLEKENRAKEKDLKNRTLIFLLSFVSVSFFGYLLFRQRFLKKQIEKTKLEQQLFRLQMNPHFIFNAIAGIRGTILSHDNENAVIYLGKFSKLLRKLLENSNKDWISIDEEIEFLNNYLSIQQERYNRKFEFAINVDESINVKNTLIPTMILQPFIENSVEHGFFNINYVGRLTINITKYGNNMLEVVIKDNGIGFYNSSKKQMDLDKSKSIAMNIVKRRLDVISKETKTNSYFRLDTENGVTITLIIACLKK